MLILHLPLISYMILDGGCVVKNLPANAGHLGSIPGLGRSPGAGKGNPLENSCLGNPMDRGAWWATVHGVVKESDRTEKITLYLLLPKATRVESMSEERSEDNLKVLVIIMNRFFRFLYCKTEFCFNQ